MGTLGRYLQDARVAKELDLRDAAQQTRISIQYLKALENDDFSKLPGEVFVKGFLKNYSRFLNLDETEVMKRYAELKPSKAKPSEAAPDTDVPSVSKRESDPEQPTSSPLSGAQSYSYCFLFFYSLPFRQRP